MAPDRRARFWPRAAAWSLDAALLAPPALLLTAALTMPAARALRAATGALLEHVGAALAGALVGGEPLPQLVFALRDDPALHASAAAVQAALWQLTWPPLLAFVLLGEIYQVACECSRRQASIGKQLLRLRVGDRHGRPVRAGRALWRYACGALSWASLNLGHALAALPPARLALHDRCSNTRVLQGGERHGLPRWAWAWLALLAIAGVVATAWLAGVAADLLRAALEQALY